MLFKLLNEGEIDPAEALVTLGCSLWLGVVLAKALSA